MEVEVGNGLSYFLAIFFCEKVGRCMENFRHEEMRFFDTASYLRDFFLREMFKALYMSFGND
jgi:hypothetical protein